ncbi:MAG: tetratricopeptide repeat protein [Opitutales bacterium]
MADKETPKPADDDRNLVNVDENYPHASEEEKLALLWKKNKGFVFIATAVFVVAVVGLQAVDAMRRGQIADQQAAYLDAVAGETLESFATENAGSPLGGAAALKAADEAYEADDFAKAQALYGKAAESLEGTPFAERARLGIGYAQAQSGDASSALSTWNNLASDSEASEGARAEASYAIAVSSLESGDDAAFGEAVARLESLATGMEYTNRLRTIAPDKL